MDIIISDNWLREYLTTSATPKEIAECVSLCGPSIEKIESKDNDILYHVEITTNRIDCVGVYGFAREVAAILPRFNIQAKLKSFNTRVNLNHNENLPFTIIPDSNLVKRTLGIVLKDIKNWKTPGWMQKRLTLCGVRSLNAVVDITNYVMLETGHPCHAFDYDKIKNKKFVIRKSKNGEKVTTFDGKTYELFGGDIVFDDGNGEIIDLPGIMGTKNSVVGENTKRIFFFVDNNNSTIIRRTSMQYAIRTIAATINEKGVDPELAKLALLRGIELYQNICKANVASQLFDNYFDKFKFKTLKTTKKFIDKSLGVKITKNDISKYLTTLEFKPTWKDDILSVIVPSFRANDIKIPEDLIEEIARIYGYHRLPSNLMTGRLPKPISTKDLSIEWKIKNILKALGGCEVYTLSLVPKESVSKESLRLKNPLGVECEYLRTNLSNSLVSAVQKNIGGDKKIFLYEMANVYHPIDNNLPEEQMTLGLCFSGYTYPEMKGVLETLFDELNCNFEITKTKAGEYLNIEIDDLKIGNIRIRDDGIIVSEIKTSQFISLLKEYRSFIPIPKHPPQIEDITVNIPTGIEVGKIIETIKSTSKLISNIELNDVYNNSYTFRISYQDPNKTLTDDEVKVVRNKIIQKLKNEYNLKIDYNIE